MKEHYAKWVISGMGGRFFSCQLHLSQVLILVRVNQYEALSVWESGDKQTHKCYRSDSQIRGQS